MASSGGRSPKDLRQMVQNSKDTGPEAHDEMKNNLEKLRALSKDDISENSMLRSRIDQQAELICILKQRADECTKKSIGFEKENKEIKAVREELLESIHTESKKHALLKQRFDVLNANHQEMISIKDSYKTQNVKLRSENEKLVHENEVLFAEKVKERDQEIERLREESKQLQANCSLAEQRVIEAEEKLEQERVHHEAVVSKLQDKLTYFEKCAAGKESETAGQLESVKHQLSMQRDQATAALKERDEFAQLAVDRGKALKEKQQENAQLSASLEEAEKTLREMEDKFASELHAMSSNAQVQRMKKQVDEMERMYHAQQKEYQAYKKHTSALLEKEKRLNDKLRGLIG
ncbi:coiled-coil domain-containing protein 89 [Nematostella vectensis]|uniref:coiled-coil domain-containing protein 89 n=1 Tax=Nematostella vectensis TaxID=45351 RepID=UPI0020776FEA|nr:coiled-coil domain-containing protein 89 [Nematostella vectensis]